MIIYWTGTVNTSKLGKLELAKSSTWPISWQNNCFNLFLCTVLKCSFNFHASRHCNLQMKADAQIQGLHPLRLWSRPPPVPALPTIQFRFPFLTFPFLMGVQGRNPGKNFCFRNCSYILCTQKYILKRWVLCQKFGVLRQFKPEGWKSRMG